MTVRIQFLGSGNAFSDGGRANAAIHVTAPGVSLLLDCGGSALPAIKKHGDPSTIDAIAVSHLHGDHFGGIPFFVLEQHFAGRTRPLVVGGPPSLERRLRAAEQALYPDFFGPTKLGFPLSTAIGASVAPRSRHLSGHLRNPLFNRKIKFETLCLMKWKSGLPARCPMFAGLPVMRLSIAMTR